jgi:hypothetical protein
VGGAGAADASGSDGRVIDGGGHEEVRKWQGEGLISVCTQERSEEEKREKGRGTAL